MMMKKITAAGLGLLFWSASALASQGLVVNVAEFGVGKFHRQDNRVHAYAAANAWSPYILPDNVATDRPLVTDNADGSVSIYFSTLDEMLASVVQVSKDRHQPVSVLNVHGHGLPGAMWFPADADALRGWECGDWVKAASGSDSANYSQYYSAVSPMEIRMIRAMSNNPNIRQGCTTGLNEWKAGVAKAAEFKSVLARDVQIHFLSCVVGLGRNGENFTRGIADLLLTAGGGGRVETSMNFGLGDWSMPEGMGFWDLQTDAQVEHDNALYVKNHTDREIAQKGTIRIMSASSSGTQAGLLADQSFMRLFFEAGTPRITPMVSLPSSFESDDSVSEALPARIRVPGTNAYVNVYEQ